MRLDEIARHLGAELPAQPEVDIIDLAYDSKEVTAGSLFFCVEGGTHDGHDFAPEAVTAGASALVTSRELALGVPALVVESPRAAMNLVAGPFFRHPSRHLELAGVTGTKGKSTICYMLRSIFEAAGFSAGLIGTIEVGWRGEITPGVRTTPQSVDLQRLFRRMVDAGVRYCAMEATSIGLHQGRVEGTEFDVGVFSNLSRDHLDEYHGTMDAYYAAKKILFTPSTVEQALINVDDSWGIRLANEIEVKSVTFGLSEPADLSARDITREGYGSRFRAVGAGLDLEVTPKLPGAVNVSNALAAVGVAHLLGIDHEAIGLGIATLEALPGRFERIEEGQNFTVMVDYAHTPDSLRESLAAARDLAPGKLIVVFGCGGDRDRVKRPLMGRVAAEGADFVVVTSDNPRTEDPMEILGQIEEGIPPGPPDGHELVLERAMAIEAAIRRARTGDVVVIAGKGHETYQEFADRTIAFDDREVAREVLRNLR